MEHCITERKINSLRTHVPRIMFSYASFVACLTLARVHVHDCGVHVHIFEVNQLLLASDFISFIPQHLGHVFADLTSVQ